MDPTSQAVLALTSRLVERPTDPLTAAELWQVAALGDPADLIGLTATELAGRGEPVGLDGARLAALLDSGVALAVRLDDLHERGIWTLTAFDAAYPARLRDRLGAAAPPVLYGAGPTELLATPGIGIVGSRTVDAVGAAVAGEAGQLAASAGLPVVTGASPGVDVAAAAGSLEAGGTVVDVLAEALEEVVGRADIRRGVLHGRRCLCTPYPPDAPYRLPRAKGRNKVIYALSRVTLVVAGAPDEDTTIHGAEQALAEGFGAVAVWRGPGEGIGNAALEEAGAARVTDLGDLRGEEPPPQGSISEA